MKIKMFGPGGNTVAFENVHKIEHEHKCWVLKNHSGTIVATFPITWGWAVA